MLQKLLLILLLLHVVTAADAQVDMSRLRAYDNLEIRMHDYKHDTLKSYYNSNWVKCKAPESAYFVIAYKSRNRWICNEYYTGESSICYQISYLDQKLEVKDGGFYHFFTNGSIQQFGLYINNKKNSYWNTYNEQGNKIDSSNYLNGQMIGENFSYYDDGKLHSLRTLNKDGSGVGTYLSYNDSGKILQIGQYSQGMEKDSVWSLFHKNGKVFFLENYNKGKIEKTSCFDPNGTRLEHCITEQLPEFPGGNEALNAYLKKNIKIPKEHENGIKYGRVLIQFVIDKDGTVTDVAVKKSLFPDFDNEVLHVVKSMPKWKPGIQYNNPVRVNYLIPVSFGIQ